MKLFFVLFFLFTLFQQDVSAQTGITVKYYDSSWIPTSKDSAYYFKEYIKEGSIFKAKVYWVKSEKLKYVLFYSDTAKLKQVGISKRYYENGQIEDSSFYNDEGKMVASTSYYPDGKIWGRYLLDANSDTETTEGYDESGNIIKGFIYFREADFPGGNRNWQGFLSEKIKTKVPVKNGAPVGEYRVMVRFIVDVNGKLVEMNPETNLGFGMEEEVIRVIRKSPKWTHAIWLNKPVKAYRRQPITFVVSDE